MKEFTIFTVGWEPGFSRRLLAPIGERTGIRFVHGVVGDARVIPVLQREFPDATWVSISKSATDPLPAADYRLLASLESIGVPTLRSLVQGDPVLRHRPATESLAYATLLVQKLNAALDDVRPDVVLGSFDNAHSALGLAVAKARAIPWVAMAFTVIPDNLTAFARGMTPEQLVPIERPIDDTLRREAKEILSRFRSRNVRILAYRPPESIAQRARHLAFRAQNLVRRFSKRRRLGVDRFTFPTVRERFVDLARRTINELRLPTRDLATTPPESAFVFFPLHMAPESSVDTWAPMYQNQLELAAQLALAVPADLEVIVKLHFSDPDNYSRAQLARVMRLPRVRVAHPGAPSRSFIERATLVAGIQGTASIEAALMGKPVLLFGDSPYQHFPRTERAKRPDELHAQIRRMLTLPPPTDDEIVEAFAGYIARYLPGRINDWTRPVEAHEFDRLSHCFRALRAYVETPGIRDEWYRDTPFFAYELESRLDEEKVLSPG